MFDQGLSKIENYRLKGCNIYGRSCRALAASQRFVVSAVIIQEDFNRVSSQRFSVLLKDVLVVLKMKCDVLVMRPPTTSPACQFMLLLNFCCEKLCLVLCFKAGVGDVGETSKGKLKMPPLLSLWLPSKATPPPNR